MQIPADSQQRSNPSAKCGGMWDLYTPEMEIMGYLLSLLFLDYLTVVLILEERDTVPTLVTNREILK